MEKETHINEILDKMSECVLRFDSKLHFTWHIESIVGGFRLFATTEIKDPKKKIIKRTYEKYKRDAAEKFYKLLKDSNWLDYNIIKTKPPYIFEDYKPITDYVK